MSAKRSDLEAVLASLGNLRSKEEVLRETYSIITARYRGKRLHTFWSAARFLAKRPESLWDRPGLMDCLHQNQLLELLLVDSGHFRKSDIERKWTAYWGFSPHQYLRVKLDGGRFINADPWSSAYGIKLGDYGRGFHTRTKE